MTVVVNGKHRCSKCKLSKPVGRFQRSTVTPCGLMGWCKDCRNKRYHEGRQYVISKAVGRPCADWGTPLPGNVQCIGMITEDNYFMIEWDHLPGHEKKFPLAHVGLSSFARIDRELEKCEAVCTGHHRLRTMNRVAHHDSHAVT